MQMFQWLLKIKHVSSFVTILTLQAICFITQAQNASQIDLEVIRLARQFQSGSARILGVGGAAVGLGADLSAVALNPAAAGMLQRTEAGFCTAAGFVNSSWEDLNQTDNMLKPKLYLPQMGINIASPRHGKKYTRGYSVAINFSRVADFQLQSNKVLEKNTGNSLVNSIINSTNGRTWEELDEQSNGVTDVAGLAYFTYLIGPNRDSLSRDIYTTPLNSLRYDSREEVNHRGAQYAWNFAVGGEFADAIYYGFSVNLLTHRFIETRSFEEIYDKNDPVLTSFMLTETRKQRGVGVNASAGLIVKASRFMRLGASIVSPSYMQVSETYNAEMAVNYNSFRVIEFGQEVFLQEKKANIEPTRIGYNLITPLRASAGIAMLVGPYGFITLDAEWVDFSVLKLQNPSFKASFDAENKRLANLYTQTINLRAGAEARIKNLRFRGGFAYFPDYLSTPNADRSNERLVYSAGIGRRFPDRFWDIVGQFYQENQSIYAYPRTGNSLSPVLKNVKASVFTLAVSYGFYF